MVWGKFASFAALLLTAAAGANAAVPRNAGKDVDHAEIARTLDCARHRFETTIQIKAPDGKLQDQTVRMCGIKGESDADWMATLKDAIKKTAASPQMPKAAKDQIIAAVKAEIARLSLPALDLPRGADISRLPKTVITKAPETPLSREYNVLPPLPTASTVPPPHVLGPGGGIVEEAHLTLRCALIGDEDRPNTCDTIDKDTVLVVRADESYPKGLAVRFMRHGNSRAEVDLPAMSAGETRSFRVPAAVCTGVVRSTVEIDALRSNAPASATAGKVGEYDLHC